MPCPIDLNRFIPFRLPAPLLCAALILCSVFAIAPLPALATGVDFEAVGDSVPLTNQYTAQNITFTNGAVLTAGVSLNEVEFPPRSGNNVAADIGGALAGIFTTPVTSVGGYFTYSSQVTLTAYDASNNVIGTAVSAFADNTVASGNAPNELIQITTPGIAWFSVSGDVNGSSFALDDLTFSNNIVIPRSPAGLTAIASSTMVSLSWTPSVSATSYNVKRSTTNSGPYTTIASLATNSYSNTGLTNGVTYYYVVSSVNSSGESPNSAQVSATPGISPLAPTGLTAVAGNASATLSWSTSAGATSYKVKRATTSGGPYTTVASPTTNGYTNTGLTNGTTYYFVVSAVNTTGESPNSAQVSAMLAIYPFDFSGDGKPDLVLQNGPSNQISVWFMYGATVTGGQYISLTPATGWKAAGVGDFNADGKPDLVLQNATLGKAAIWYLNGTTFATGQYVSANLPSGWSIAAVGDFNGDGKPDLVLQSASTNQVAFWYMNGATITSGGYASATPGAGWRVVGAGDFNADGKTDLVLQNSTSKQVAFWYLNGATLIGGAYASAIPPAGYSVVGIGDFNGDHKPDLVLQDSVSNKAAFWYMNGVTVAGGAYTSITPPSGWQVVGPR